MPDGSPLEIVVLAAGQGKRMASGIPKVLHPLGGRAMLLRVVDALVPLRPVAIHFVVGHQAERLRAQAAQPIAEALALLPDVAVHWVLQTEQKGTGDAVMRALPGIHPDSRVLIVYGDVPLLTPTLLASCADGALAGGLTLITAVVPDPAELGRIVRGPAGHIQQIVEFRDADAGIRAINEINSGILAAPAGLLATLLAGITPDNAQGEYYLTDIVARAVARGETVRAQMAPDPEEILGVNDRAQLAQLERALQARIARSLLAQGVSLADPARLDVRGSVAAEQDCFIDVNVVLEGTVRLGRQVSIGPGCVIRNSTIADGVTIEAHSVIDGAEIGADCTVGPFARIRPGTTLGAGARVGNFVETKKTTLGAGSKANHLAYLGDATIGDDCNIGAGTITCNYDGIDKHPTTIGDRVFVGTNSTLVAPIVIGSDAFVAAGSTVTTTVREGELAVGRTRQRNIGGWVRPDRRSRTTD